MSCARRRAQREKSYAAQASGFSAPQSELPQTVGTDKQSEVLTTGAVAPIAGGYRAINACRERPVAMFGGGAARTLRPRVGALPVPRGNAGRRPESARGRLRRSSRVARERPCTRARSSPRGEGAKPRPGSIPVVGAGGHGAQAGPATDAQGGGQRRGWESWCGGRRRTRCGGPW